MDSTISPNVQKEIKQETGLAQKDFLSIPNQNFRWLYNSFLNKDNLSLFAERQDDIGKGHAKVIVSESKHAIKFISGETEAIFSFKNVEKLSKCGRNYFLYLWHKIGLQNITTNLLEDVLIDIHLQEIIDIGMYKNLDTARRAFLKCQDELEDIKVKFMALHKKKCVMSDGVPLFSRVHYEPGLFSFYLNSQIDWKNSFLMTYFNLPLYYFGLKNDKAQDLMVNIFSIARQRKEELLKNGNFHLSYKYIVSLLGLPKLGMTVNPTRDIIKPIEDAAASIVKGDCKSIFIEIKNICDKQLSIASQIETGYLEIKIKGLYLEKLKNLSFTEQAKVKEAQDKKEKRIERAIAINLAKSMEADKEKPLKSSS